MKKLILFFAMMPSLAIAKDFIVKVGDVPPSYRILNIDVTPGSPPPPNPPNFACDAPTDKAQLQTLLDAQSQTDSLTVVKDPRAPGGCRGAIDTVKQAARQAEIDAAKIAEARAAASRSARANQLQALAQKVKDKTITPAERDAAIDAMILQNAKGLD